ncbi:hypothetical protein BGZ94_009096, partial [Podila epigama]
MRREITLCNNIVDSVRWRRATAITTAVLATVFCERPEAATLEAAFIISQVSPLVLTVFLIKRFPPEESGLAEEVHRMDGSFLNRDVLHGEVTLHLLQPHGAVVLAGFGGGVQFDD